MKSSLNRLKNSKKQSSATPTNVPASMTPTYATSVKKPSTSLSAKSGKNGQSNNVTHNLETSNTNQSMSTKAQATSPNNLGSFNQIPTTTPLANPVRPSSTTHDQNHQKLSQKVPNTQNKKYVPKDDIPSEIDSDDEYEEECKGTYFIPF